MGALGMLCARLQYFFDGLARGFEVAVNDRHLCRK